MIWAFLITYFLGGGIGGASGSLLTVPALNQLGEQTELIVSDSPRAEAAQHTLSALGKEAKDFEKIFFRSGRQLNKFYGDHAAEPAQAIALLDDLAADWQAYQQRALDLRFELKSSLTEEEWNQLFGDG